MGFGDWLMKGLGFDSKNKKLPVWLLTLYALAFLCANLQFSDIFKIFFPLLQRNLVSGLRAVNPDSPASVAIPPALQRIRHLLPISHLLVDAQLRIA